MSINVRKGTVYGLLAAVSQFQISLFAPIILIMSLVFMPVHRSLTRQDGIILILIGIKLIWMATIQVTIGQLTLFDNIRIFLPDIILLVFALLQPNRKFINSFFRAAYFLFLVDMSFNLSIVLFGSDILGRSGALRPGDFAPRVGGIFGHPFTSVQVTVIGIISAIALKKRGLLLIAMFGFLLNGTFRSPMALGLSILILVAIRSYPRTWLLALGSIVFAALVVTATIMTATDIDGFVTGNFLRVHAWTTAVENIIQHPILGKHDFATGTFEGMSADIITMYGIAESGYLQLWLNYGILAPMLTLIILYKFLNKSVLRHRNYPNDPLVRAGLFISVFVFADFFWGTFFGTVLTTTAFSLLLLGYDPKNESQNLLRSGRIL